MYNLVACGGTFDHFHKGHREFLKSILTCSKKVLLGLTSDSFVSRKERNTIIDTAQPYALRKKNLEAFLAENNALERVKTQPISNVFIPDNWLHLPIEAIIVSQGTVGGAEAVNKQRIGKGLKPLPVKVIPLVLAEDGLPISSSRIRKGEVNNEGRLWVRKNWLKTTAFLPDTVRSELHKPFSAVITDFDAWIQSKGKKNELRGIISVGDVISQTLNKLGIMQQIAVFDFYVERKKIYSQAVELGFKLDEVPQEVKNEAGTISDALFTTIFTLFKDSQLITRKLIYINGEDDLAVIPLVLSAPLGWIIFYGQPKEGVVAIIVDEKMKEKAYRIMNKFILN